MGLGTGALILGVNAIRNRLNDDTAENTAATITADDNAIVKGEASGAVTYTISDADGIDQSALKDAVEAAPFLERALVLFNNSNYPFRYAYYAANRLSMVYGHVLILNRPSQVLGPKYQHVGILLCLLYVYVYIYIYIY